MAADEEASGALKFLLRQPRTTIVLSRLQTVTAVNERTTF